MKSLNTPGSITARKLVGAISRKSVQLEPGDIVTICSAGLYQYKIFFRRGNYNFRIGGLGRGQSQNYLVGQRPESAIEMITALTGLRAQCKQRNPDVSVYELIE